MQVSMGEFLLDLFTQLAWPLTVLVLALFVKQEIKDLLASINKRIIDPRTQFQFGKEGITLATQLDVVQSQMESMQVDQEQFKQMVMGASENNQAGLNTTQDEIPVELVKMATEYLNVSISNLPERLRVKEAYANQMTNIVLSKHVSKDLLLTQDNEGLILAMAGAIHAFPKKEDLDRITKVVSRVERLHVRYRLVMAVSRLIERHLIEKVDVLKVNYVLDEFLKGADMPLQRLVKRTRVLLNELVLEND